MVKSIFLYDLFFFRHNLITWLIPEQCHILNDAVACPRFSVSAYTPHFFNEKNYSTEKSECMYKIVKQKSVEWNFSNLKFPSFF